MSYYGIRRRVLEILPLVVLAKMKHHNCGNHAVLERVVQALRRQELGSDVLKFQLLDGHVLHVLKLVLTKSGREETKRPHATDGAVANKLWRYQVTRN